MQLLQNGLPLDLSTVPGIRLVIAPDQGTSPSFDYAWTGLPAVDLRGNPYAYTLRELAVPDGYRALDVRGTGSQDDPFVLVNAYLNPAQLVIPGLSELVGAAIQPGQFTFQLLDNEWNQLAIAQNNADGSITFPGEIISQGGRSVYLMRQIIGTQANIQYDPAVYAVIVESVLDENNNYLLHVSYKKDGTAYSGTPLFVNRLIQQPVTPPVYSPITVSLTASKQLYGAALKEGQFQFVLKDAAGNIVSKVANRADGTLRFEDRTFSREGVFLYHLSEVNDRQPGIAYDTSTYMARVSVSAHGNSLRASVRYLKDGQLHAGTPVFINQRPLPQTGDPQLRLITALGLIAMGLSVAAWLLHKKSRRSR